MKKKYSYNQMADHQRISITMKYFLMILFGLIINLSYAQIINHTYEINIPNNYLDSIKQNIKLQWCGQSHSHQLTTGFELLESDNPIYDVSIGQPFLPSDDAFDVMEGLSMFGQCGNCCWQYILPQEYWASTTAYNNMEKTFTCYPEINISAFEWCTELETASVEYVNRYLDSMAVYEIRYPTIRFVYTTQHAQSDGINGYNRYLRNNQIRQYCIDNNKLIYDFGDLDCWSNGDFSYYLYNGDTIPVQHPDYNGSEYSHTNELGCENKAKAMWFMMALLQGWNPQTFNFEIWQQQAGQSGTNLEADYNKDGNVNNQDKAMFFGNK